MILNLLSANKVGGIITVAVAMILVFGGIILAIIALVRAASKRGGSVSKRAPKSYGEVLQDFKCLFSGEDLRVTTAKDQRVYADKFQGYTSELVFKKVDDTTVKGGRVAKYAKEWVGGKLQERLHCKKYGYDILYTQERQSEWKETPTSDNRDGMTEYYIDKYTYELERYGSLDQKQIKRLRRICNGASYTYKHTA